MYNQFLNFDVSFSMPRLFTWKLSPTLKSKISSGFSKSDKIDPNLISISSSNEKSV